MIKTEHELAALKYAADATCAAHKELMRTVRPGCYEYQLERCICLCQVLFVNEAFFAALSYTMRTIRSVVVTLATRASVARELFCLVVSLESIHSIIAARTQQFYTTDTRRHQMTKALSMAIFVSAIWALSTFATVKLSSFEFLLCFSLQRLM